MLFGNHIDAWVFGAVDPSSGTSVMMEIARVLGETMKTGIENLVGWLKKILNGEPQVSDELGSSINLKEKLMNERVIKKQDTT